MKGCIVLFESEAYDTKKMAKTILCSIGNNDADYHIHKKYKACKSA